MANLDSVDKRRSATGIFHIYTIPPKPDGTIDAQDREQATWIYSGITVGGVPVITKRPGQLLLLGVSQ